MYGVIIIFVYTQFKRLAHGLSLMLSLIMGVMFLITSSMMSNIYAKYCEHLKDQYNPFYDNDNHCGELEKHFLMLPVFGYITMVAWVRYL